MAYIGVQPTDTYLSIASQQITGTGSATYTLDYSVSNEEDVAVFVNNVRQNVSTYTVSGTSLTLGGTISASDSCWVLFLGRTVGTKTPAVGSVTNAMLQNSSITLNGSAVSLGGSASVDNTPSFFAYLSTQQNGIAQTSYTLATLQSTLWDSHSAYNTSTYTYTIPTGQGGKYCFFYGGLFGNLADGNFCEFILYVNGSGKKSSRVRQTMGTAQSSIFRNSCILNVSAGDTVQLYVYHNNGSTQSLYVENETTCLGGFKLIGV